ILCLIPLCGWPFAMFHTPGAKAFFDAWQGLRQGNQIPHYRTVFDRMAPEFISRLMICDVVLPDTFLVRFMGTTVLELWKEEVTGKDMMAMLPAANAGTARKNMAVLLTHPCGMRNLGVFAVSGGTDVKLENVFLPLGNDPGRPQRLLIFGQELGRPDRLGEL